MAWAHSDAGMDAYGVGMSPFEEEETMYKGHVAAVGFCNAMLQKALIAEDHNSSVYFSTTEYLQQLLTKQTCIESLEDEKKTYTILGAAAGELKQVCLAECDDLIAHIIDNAERIQDNVNTLASGLATLCSAYVVKAVENRVLKCCADTCGWDGQSCARVAIPFQSFVRAV